MMTTLSLLMIVVLAASLVAARMRRKPTGPTPPPKALAAQARRKAAAIAKPAGTYPEIHPKLDALEWDAGPGRTTAPRVSHGDVRAQMRDRYIAARFPGVFRSSADLRKYEYVVSVARHYFEEGMSDRADELFALAIEQSPEDFSMRLAQLEIAFLARDAGHFTRLARELKAARPDMAEWSEVVRLGHAIAPAEALFGASPGVREYEHYGPWPDMPNWIQASWDLTPEVQGADFHHAMAERARKIQRPALRRAA